MVVRLGIVDRLVGMSANILRILMYHGISEISLTTEMFEKQLMYVKERFECRWVSEIPGLFLRTNRNGSYRRPIIILTFDDGLKNNATVIAPLLKKHNIKATFFITAGIFNGKKMLWNHEICCRLMIANKYRLPIGYQRLSNEPELRWGEIKLMVESLKKSGKYMDVLEELRAIEPNPRYEKWMLDEYLLMNKNDILNFPPQIEIGSHTISHPILSGLDDIKSKEEIKNSKILIEDNLKRAVTTFCYPDGNYLTRDIEYARQVYDVAVSTQEGFVTREGQDMYELKRIPAAKNMDDFIFRMIRPIS